MINIKNKSEKISSPLFHYSTIPVVQSTVYTLPTNQRLLWILYEVLTRPINPNNVQAVLLSKESLVPIKLIDGYLIILNSLLSIKLHMYVTKSIHTHTHTKIITIIYQPSHRINCTSQETFES